MSTDLTDAAVEAVAAAQNSDAHHEPVPRDELMYALSSAESAVGALQFHMPRSLDLVGQEDGTYEVRLQFSEEPACIREFATAFDVPVTVAPHQSREGHSFTEAVAHIQGVRVIAWTLTEDEPGEATVETPAPEPQEAGAEA